MRQSVEKINYKNIIYEVMSSKLFNFVLFILFPSLNQASVRGVAESHKTKIIHREREWRILKWRARDVKKTKPLKEKA